MPLLKKGQIIKSDVSGERYRVDTACIRKGGFGEIYRGTTLGPTQARGKSVALKATRHALAWHGEAYFGRLLADDSRVVHQLDAFPVVDTSGKRRRVLYALALEWLEQGSLRDEMKDAPDRFPESCEQVRLQLRVLLELLELLHRRGICHGDITPGNVFLRNEELVLGDFGISAQIIYGDAAELEGFTPEVFAPPDAYNFEWAPTDDVYQVGLIALSLLTGVEMINEDVYHLTLKTLVADDDLKGWIRDATLGREDRFQDAGEALEALELPEPASAKVPRSLAGQHVAITGILSVTRDELLKRVRAAGAIYENHVTDRTSILVAGRQNVLQIGVGHSVKRYDAYRRMRRGQSIAVLGERQIERILRRA